MTEREISPHYSCQNTVSEFYTLLKYIRMVMARIFREYRNTVVNYKQFPSHLRKKKIYFPCDRNVSLCTVLTFSLRKSEQRNFFLAFFGGRNWQDLSWHSCLFHFSKSQQTRSMQSDTASH